MRVLCLLITLITVSPHIIAGVQPRTQVCDFDGDTASRVYKIVPVPGVGTTFRLPEGWRINDFVVADPKAFHAESNGTIGIITPLVPNKSTSVSIYTDNDKLFVFNLTSEPDPAGVVDQLVGVECNDLQFFKQKVRSEAQRLAKDQIEAAEAQCSASQEQKARQLKEQLLFSINSNYIIIDRNFSVTKVADDGIFTYIQLAQSPDRPVVYLGESNDQKKLEPVKYTDEGAYYIVHHVLTSGDKRFFLKLGDEVSEIRRGR